MGQVNGFRRALDWWLTNYNNINSMTGYRYSTPLITVFLSSFIVADLLLLGFDPMLFSSLIPANIFFQTIIILYIPLALWLPIFVLAFNTTSGWCPHYTALIWSPCCMRLPQNYRKWWIGFSPPVWFFLFIAVHISRGGHVHNIIHHSVFGLAYSKGLFLLSNLQTWTSKPSYHRGLATCC